MRQLKDLGLIIAYELHGFRISSWIVVRYIQNWSSHSLGKKVHSYLIDNFDMHNAAVLLMFVTGMRIGEVAIFKHENINFINNTVSVRRTETRYKKTAKIFTTLKNIPKQKDGIRNIVVPTSYKWLLIYLSDNSSEQDYVFTENSKRLTTLLIRERTYKICKEVGVYKKPPHKIRATYDAILLDNGIDKRFVKDQMGHADIKTSEVNYHRNRKDIDTKQRIIDGIKKLNVV